MSVNPYSTYQSKLEGLQSELEVFRGKMRQGDASVDLDQLDALQNSARELLKSMNGLSADSESGRRTLSKLKVDCHLLSNEPGMMKRIFESLKEKAAVVTASEKPSAGPEDEVAEPVAVIRPQDEEVEDLEEADEAEEGFVESPSTPDEEEAQTQVEEKPAFTRPSASPAREEEAVREEKVAAKTQEPIATAAPAQVQEQKPSAKPMGRRAAKLAALRRRGVRK